MVSTGETGGGDSTQACLLDSRGARPSSLSWGYLPKTIGGKRKEGVLTSCPRGSCTSGFNLRPESRAGRLPSWWPERRSR